MFLWANYTRLKRVSSVFRVYYTVWRMMTVAYDSANESYTWSKSLCWWYINIITDLLDIIHHHVFYLKECFGDWTLSLPLWRQELALWIGPNWVGFLPKGRDRVQSLKRFKYIRSMMENVQKVNNWIRHLIHPDRWMSNTWINIPTVYTVIKHEVKQHRSDFMYYKQTTL
jgi:hypothetical protein